MSCLTGSAQSKIAPSIFHDMQYFYDLHLHSCLSPCADNDMTPNNIAGMLSLSGIGLAALTDHNTCKNCPAFFEAAARYGVIPVPGMELTTSEEIHVVCLFPGLSEAMAFDGFVSERRMKLPNRTEIFGDQLITDGEDNVTGTDPYFLPAATGISVDEVPGLVEGYGGVSYPAHVDRESGGIIAILGTFPDIPGFCSAEFHDRSKQNEYFERYPLLKSKRILISSDAHNLWGIRDKEAFLELDEGGDDDVRRALIGMLKTDKSV